MKRYSFDRVPDEAIADLHARIDRFRSVPLPRRDGLGGVDPGLVAEVMRHWREDYDWRLHEDRIASWPWWETEHTAVPVRAMIAAADRDDAPVVLLLHGWPDSVLRFERILPLLGDVTLVVPALPGFPFAAPVENGGMSSVEMADAVADAMAEFGFDRYVISAGDVGCDVGEAIAARHGRHVGALHLTDLSQYHFLVGLPDDLTAEETAYVRRGHDWQRREGGYMHEQSTRPLTLAAGLGDSPAGLAAWILEKLVDWTDSGGDLSAAFTLDEALTWISAYWFTGTIATSFTPYAAAAAKDWPRIEIPTVITVFPKDLVNAPRHFVERFFEVVDWFEFPRGGHFAAWEAPESYVQGVGRALEVRRSAG
ncbi:epoxide hydrolase [Leifsonia shinshuensis]|uniref:epoxide hydrolase n=1 Tax=Leifsonia shinshuensis TaxID=150026 RepID=UPI00285C2710|nr:epoxide hydrolase [Leifsonia shinshuensis]MDR6972819.1 pimeloyl-ACP methyl ester carboxylesterase [Leifsonia shinshuensis]